MKSYKNEYPNSITAGVALAKAFINYGWFARGFGYIDAVSNSELELLRERLSLAEKELIEAKSLDVRCPRWYREALYLGMATGMSKPEFKELFEEAIKFEPNYLQFYLVKSEYLMPRWSGKPGDWEEYMNSLPNELTKLKTDEIDIIFFVVAVNKLKAPDNLNAIMASRQRIYKGFNDLEKKYKLDNKRLNQGAYISFVTSNLEGAKWAFNQIGDNWDKDVWGNKQTFDSIKLSLYQGNSNLKRQTDESY